MNSVPKDSLKYTWKSGENQISGCTNCSGKNSNLKPSWFYFSQLPTYRFSNHFHIFVLKFKKSLVLISFFRSFIRSIKSIVQIHENFNSYILNRFKGAFVYVTTTKEKMTFTYLNTKGEEIYTNLTVYPKSSSAHSLRTSKNIYFYRFISNSHNKL